MLLFILLYLKTGTLQEIHAHNFSISQPKANKYIHLFGKILLQCMKYNGFAPLRHGADLKTKLKRLGIHHCYIDGTEREIPRSTDYETQKEFYSGKAKKHMIKKYWIILLWNLIIIQ